MNEESVFLAALQKPTPEERAAFLNEACAGQAELRHSVELLLRAHERAGQFLENRPDAISDLPSRESPGTVVGPYKLLEQIGEGGFGIVFKAEQTEPVRRKVALKILKAGMDTRQVIARFEAERQALAIMDHPNIARVFDGGVIGEPSRASDRVAGNGNVTRRLTPLGSPDPLGPLGRPYFVMELVHGAPITKYCDDNRLTPRQRLELFVPVCQAIQHAHQKGIIHRDIKPSNVMVTLYDGKPVPKVIDFGVAKATEQKLTERTLFTQYGTIVGTFEYVSPEQAEMSAQGVDTRSDVYSLGVLLYELLTGSTPLSNKRLKEAAYGEILRMIKEEEPPKPSTRLSDSGELASIAAQRHVEPAKLTKLVKGELDWIVMKCLEKDRNRRYETANGLARDVERYLSDEAVEACPPSAGYRLRKFAKRHKAVFRAAAAFTGVLILGVVISTWQAVRATLAEADVRTERDKALAEKERADEEAAIARAVNDFLQNDLLAEAAPEKNARTKQVTVEALLGRAAARIAGKFDQQPRIEAAIRQTIGDAYLKLGAYPAAQPHMERALELRRRVLGEEHDDTMTTLNNLALLYLDQGQLAKAEQLFVESLDVRRRVLGQEHPDTLTAMNNLALAYQDQGQLPKAEQLLIETLEIRRRVQGVEHPLTLTAMNNLALLYLKQGQLAKAEPLFGQNLEIRRRVQGEEHPDTLTNRNNLAMLYHAQRQFAKAEQLLAQNLEARRRVQGVEHPLTLTAMNNLAVTYLSQGQRPQAEPLFVKVLEVRRRVLGEEHADTLTAMNNLAKLYQAQGQFAKAEPLFHEALKKLRKRHGEGLPPVADTLSALGFNLLQQKEHAEAEPLLRECLRIREAKRPDEWTTFDAQSLLGGSLLGQQKYAEAEPLLLAGYEGMSKRAAKMPPLAIDKELRASLERLVQLYEATGNEEKAAEWRSKREQAKDSPKP